MRIQAVYVLWKPNFISPMFIEWHCHSSSSEFAKVQQYVWLTLNFLLYIILNLSYHWDMGVWPHQDVHCRLFSLVPNFSLVPFCSCVPIWRCLLDTVVGFFGLKLKTFNLLCAWNCYVIATNETRHTFKKRCPDIALMEKPLYKDRESAGKLKYALLMLK